MVLRLFILYIFVVSTYAQIGSVSIELSPPNLLITGSSVLITWRVEQPSDPQNFDLTFVSTCPTRPVPLQSVQPNNPPASATGASVTSGSFLVGLCDGDRIENTINVVAREVTSPGLNFSNPVTVLSDTIPPDPPNINPESDNFPKTVFTQTFQVFGNVDNSIPAGNATDKPETAGSVTIFFVDGIDPATGLDRRVILGGGLIQPNANFVATVDLSTLTFGQQVNLFIVATDPLGQESRPPKSLGLVTRGNGDNVALDNLRMTPPAGSITRHPGVLVEGTVSGSVAPFAVKFYVNGFLNSEVGGLVSGQGFAHTLNLTQEGNNCIAAEVENGNTPIFKGPRQEIGCIELDRVPPAAPNIVSPNPSITLVTKGPNFDLRVFTEGDKNLTNTLLPKLYVTGPNGISFSPISPISIQQGGSEQNITVGIANLPDGQHTIELQAEDEVGNTAPGSIARFSFIKDTKSPIVEEVRVNNVIAPQDNPPLFTRSDSIRVTIRLNEPSVTPPNLQVTPFNGTAFSAGFAEGGGTVFTYSFGVTSGQDGPVRINVSGGGDQAGNTITFDQNNLFFVDTKAPIVKDMIPAQFSVLSQSPERIRIIFEDPLYEPNGKVSGVDPSSATLQNITLLGPANNTIPIDIIEFDPITIDIIPKSPVTLEGNYQLGIRISDKAGNFSAKDTRLFFMDFTRIPEDDIKCLPEEGGFARFGVLPFLDGSPHFVEVKVNNTEFDVLKSSLVVKNIREIPQTLPGIKSSSTTDTMRYTLNTPLPKTTEKDGRYLIESIVLDRAGNRTDSACTFIYDNCAPSVTSIFPENLSFTAKNLRSVSAILKDCQPRFDVEFSDIDLKKSTIKLFQVSGTGGVETEILSRLRFETLPDQKAQKLLLEIVTTDGVTTSLPNDGSADGLYRIEVVPVDKSGNQGAVATSTFTLDTQAPILEIDALKDGQSILANNILLKGRVRDNPNGSGMLKIEVKVESLEGTTPSTVLMDFSPVFMAGPGLPPFSPNPPFHNYLQEIQLTLNQDVDARITLRAYDKAGNYNDFFWKVRLIASDLKPPVKSQPLSNFSTNLYFVHFAWERVLEATSYEIELITPNINSKIYHTQNTYETINVAALAEGEGAYQWTIRAIDALGKKGQKSTSTRFYIDQTKPKINSIQIQDPSPESKGAITAGITRFLITFSEPVNINAEPKVFLQPVDIGQFPEQKLEILSFQETTLLARIKIEAPTATKPGLHGLGRLIVQNISDLATNPMEAQDGGINVFEIHSGPYFDFKFFTNPVDRDALTIAVKGLNRKGGLSVDVPTEPSVIAISTNNQEIALPVLRLTQSAFSTNLHLSSMANNSFLLKISGQDKYGNTNTIVQHIPISSVYASKSSILGMDKLTIDIPKDAVSKDHRVVMVPAESTITPRQPELELIEELPSLLHPLSLAKSSQIQGSLASVSSTQLPTNAGLFTLVDGEWTFVSKLQWFGDNSFNASSNHLGPMAIFRDPTAPSIEMLGIKDKDKLEFLVQDYGSGVDWKNTYFQNGSDRFLGELDEKSAAFYVRVPESVNRVEGHLIASDKIGNQIHSSLIQANISRVFQFQPGIYPNPVRNQMNFELNTNFIPDSAEMYVYDSSSRLVFSQSLALSSTRQTYNWDLRNRRGGEVKNGVYFLRLKVTENGRTHKKDLKFAVLK